MCSLILNESVSILRDAGWYFSFTFKFNRAFGKQTVPVSEDPDQTPRFAASDQGMYSLPMSHKRTLGL